MKQLAYTLSKVLFYFYAALYLFVMIFSILAFLEYKYGIEIPFVEIIENRPKVHVPILGLNINIPLGYSILLMWTAMTYYAIYFYVFKDFMEVFIKKNTFELKSLNPLKWFLILNVLPLIYIILFTVSFIIKGITIRFEDDYFIVLAHLIIAFLVYLYLDVVKKGRYIQEENDLTI